PSVQGISLTKLTSPTLQTQDERREAEHFWTVLDGNKDGKVTFEEFKAASEKDGAKLSDEMLREKFDDWDLNGDGIIDQSEFWKSVMMQKEGTTPGVLKILWQGVDKDKTGYTTFDNFLYFFENELPIYGGKLDAEGKATMKALFDQADTDHDGKLNFDEFIPFTKAIFGPAN
ncbi:Calcium-dependent protein kinase 13, partial [Tulasnella sp. 427]